ncbi:predicted protein [Chaetoceros tenuissimus]|uniref:Uncharacterized protein n=1 Tax=Chaetoceros tenuissimus TaxID=426638 RepID=A0AAD3H2Y6_9STRA|nr:predicted protein [Chaetoceros tenuissimus]
MKTHDFIRLANEEHDALTDYCNSFAELSMQLSSNSINKTSPVVQYEEDDMYMNFQAGIHLHDTKRVESQSQQYVLQYIGKLEMLREVHASLIRKYNELKLQNMNEKILDELERHTKISTRVIASVASSTTKGLGPIHMNGMQRNVTGNGDQNLHELRMVSLVSLRASVEQVKSALEKYS